MDFAPKSPPGLCPWTVLGDSHLSDPHFDCTLLSVFFTEFRRTPLPTDQTIQHSLFSSCFNQAASDAHTALTKASSHAVPTKQIFIQHLFIKVAYYQQETVSFYSPGSVTFITKHAGYTFNVNVRQLKDIIGDLLQHFRTQTITSLEAMYSN